MQEIITERRSIRSFTDEPISDLDIDEILTMGTWAPSGLNNQPWKFAIVRNPAVRGTMAEYTRYSSCIESAAVCIAVFLDTEASYHREKDIQAIGACIQNMLLTIHAKALGAVWLGEILNHHRDVEQLLQVPNTMELMAVIALGHPAEPGRPATRVPASECILYRD